MTLFPRLRRRLKTHRRFAGKLGVFKHHGRDFGAREGPLVLVAGLRETDQQLLIRQTGDHICHYSDPWGMRRKALDG